MLGALCFGLPQLCLPQSTDQPFNTAALLPTGAALAIQPGQLTSRSVTEAISSLLDDSAFREAAGQLRDQIDAMPDADTVLDQILANRRQ